MDILNEIKTFLKKYKLLNKETHFLVGFSGGADSLLLLYYLKELQNIYGFKISALHINHGWRGIESDKEEENCKQFCEKYLIPFYRKKLSVDIKQDENSARIARYEIFNNYAKKINATAILTAHNATDVIETFIYRLAKGMGAVGALAIPEVREGLYCKIYRPVINVSASEIRKNCKNIGLNFNIDSSNANNKYKRNLIRNEILPILEAINPKYEIAFKNFIENLKSNQKIVDEFYEKNCDKIIKDNKILTKKFLEFSNDIKRVIVYKYIKNNDIEPEKGLILKFIKYIEKNASMPNGKKYSVKNAKNSAKGLFFFCSQKECYFVEKSQKTNTLIKYNDKFSIPIKTEKYTGQKIPKSEDYMVIVSKSALQFPLELRSRKQGDFIQPFSHKSTIKLKDYLIDKKIPEHKRDEMMFLCKGKEVLWAIGVGINEKLRADLTSPHNCLVLRYIKA